MHRPLLLGLTLVLAGGCATLHSASSATLTLEREGHWLIVHGPQLPGGSFRINYLEAYCRAGSTDADWRKHTVIAHDSELLSLSADRRVMHLRDRLADGVIVEHTITAGAGEVDFHLVARNPGTHRSEAQWAQPCVRLSRFTGHDEKTASNAMDYLPQCFIFLDGKLTRMPTRDWATQARYTPGQAWCPAYGREPASALAAPTGQWPDWLHERGWQTHVGYGVGAISGTLPRRGALPAFRLPPRRSATG